MRWRRDRVVDISLFDCRIDAGGISAAGVVLQSGQLAAGPHVSALEAELSARLAGRPVVALSDMTQALEMALRLGGVGAGDEVLALSYNCLSSNTSIHRVGAVPAWVEIDAETASMDVAHARSRVTASTRALMVYHVAGYPADMAGLRALSDEAGLVLIEDANNALGGVLPDGRPVGTVGDYAVFSFYANRQVNAVEGAALVCPDEATAAKARRLRRFGIEQSGFRDARGEIDPLADVPDLGCAATMPNVNAALARHGLALLDGRQRQIRANADAMISELAGVPGIMPIRALAGGVPAYWSLLLLCDTRDRLLDALKSAGVACSKLHQPNHVYSGFVGDTVALPQTERFIDAILAIPCGWWVGPDERRKIVDVIYSTQGGGPA